MELAHCIGEINLLVNLPSPLETVVTPSIRP